MNLFKYIFDFKTIKLIKISQKGGNYRAGPTWMRRGTQGHVAEPHGPTQAPASRECDVCIFIFTRNIGL